MNRKFRLNSYIFLPVLILLLFRSALFAGQNIYVKNYTKQEYQAASQNWSVAQAPNGYLYFANNVGLLEFDGVTWKLYPAPEGAVIRAVAVDQDGRIFTAGYRELGYWLENEFGQLVYHSLKEQVKARFTTNEEFWEVIVTGGKVYFQSFSGIYIFDYKSFRVITHVGFINSMSDGGDRIFVNLMNQGVYQIEGNQLVPYLVGDQFNNTDIRFVLSVSKTKKLIGTSNKGLLFYDGRGVVSWLPEQTDYFRKNVINRGCVTADGKIVVGTLLDGISVYNESGRLLQRLNKENGLQNNTVLGVIADTNKELWVSLDKGIDFISLTPDPSYTIVERNEIGTVYSAAVYRDQLYLGTNQGLYRRPFGDIDQPFVLVPGTQAQVWDLNVLDDRLFVSHNNGTFIIHNDEMRYIPISGGFSIVENPFKPNSLVQGTYSNIVFFGKDRGEWKIDHVVYEFNDLVRFIEIDHLGNFWASQMYRGVFRLRFDARDSLVYKRYYGAKTFGQDHNIHVFKIENRIVFTTGERLYTYDDLNDTVVVYQALNNKLDQFQKATRIIKAPGNRYWFITGKAIGLFSIRGTEVKELADYPVGLFNNQLMTGYENVVPVSEDVAILCLENGYAILHPDSLSPASRILEKKPDLREMVASKGNGQAGRLPVGASEIKLRNSHNNLQLRFSFPFFSRNKIRYQSLVEGLETNWSEPVATPIFNFKRIPVGTYTVQVKAVNDWGVSSKIYALRVIVLPPWYGSTLAYAAYVLIAFCGLFLFRKTIISRTRKKESREREEKERELIKLRNEKLQAELSFKSSELASSTMAIIKKNEFLMNMKEFLRQQKEQLGSRYPDKYYDSLVRKIDGNIESQDDWKIFETNFERAHEQFMKTLKTNYPDLTASDLRLCAFLRMNLSSKEIAPLLGISVRGVENHRYRLRKKLNLDNDANLTEFIIGL
jgi:DNA-binding CsgD family transcriptional regulator